MRRIHIYTKAVCEKLIAERRRPLEGLVRREVERLIDRPLAWEEQEEFIRTWNANRGW